MGAPTHLSLNVLLSWDTYASWSLAADVPVAKLAKLMGTSIGQIESTYHRPLDSDVERYGSALDTFRVAV